MKFWDYHTHNRLCNHAVGSLEDYIQAAIKKNLVEIGLSDHFPMNLLPKTAELEIFAMKMKEFPDYIAESKRLKKKYENEIIIRIASEVDYCPQSFDDYKEAIKPFQNDFDYIIGSVHILNFEGIGEHYIDGPDNPELMKKYGRNLFYRKYFERLTMMVKTGFYDIVGHCDLPKKYGFLPTDNSWKYILKFLDVVKEKSMVVEINTSGFYKKAGSQYPSENIIREIVKRKIPITLGSDSHKTEYLAYKFEDIIQKLKKIQTEEKVQVNLCKFSNRKKILIPLK